MRKLQKLSIIVIIMLLAGCSAGSHTSPPEPPPPPQDIRVIDADTIDIDGTRYRLHGIDAPESYQTCRAWGHTWECGKAATQAFRSHIEGVSCTQASTDRYGRAIGHCSVGDEDINAWLVRNGWAIAYYSTDYVDEEAQAKAARLGIHRGQYVEPSARRKGERLQGDDTLAWDTTGRPVDVPELANSLLWSTAVIDGGMLQASVFGLTDAGAVSFGDWQATNPTETATWTGTMIARDAAGVRTTGSARLTVDLEAQPDVDLMLSSPLTGPLTWQDVPLNAGSFQSADQTMQGRFFGSRQTEAGGVFTRHGWVGAFGLASEKTSQPQ